MAKPTPRIPRDGESSELAGYFHEAPPATGDGARGPATVDRVPEAEPVIIDRARTDWERAHSRWTAHWPNDLLAEMDQEVAATKAAGEKTTKNKVAVEAMRIGLQALRDRRP